MIKLLDILREIKVNNPSVTIEKVDNLTKELDNLKIQSRENWNKYSYYKILEKYGFSGVEIKIKDFIETLNQIQLANLYQELIKLKEN